jgi:GNAT superfamily N-acetyltransferase
MAEQHGRLRIRDLGRPGDVGWVVMANGEVYAEEFGWDATFEVFCAPIVADAAARSGTPGNAAWIAELDGLRCGCVFLVGGEAPGMAKLRMLLVQPRARGRGLGARLVGTAVDFADAAGYERVQLWTNNTLAAARHVYLAHGFSLIREEPHHSFGVDLIGQTYELDLRDRDRSRPGAGVRQPVDTRR